MEPRLTPLGRRAEKRLAVLERRRQAYMGTLDRLHGADTRDRIDEQIDTIEAKFADDTSNYWVQSKRRPSSLRRE